MEKLRKIVETGIEAFSGVSGVGIGLLIGGPLGAVSGAVASPFISTTLKEVGNQISKSLGKREEERVGYVIGTLAERFQNKSDKGILLRNDKFFEDSEFERSSGKAILEKLIQITQKEVEEKKLPFLMNLYEYVAFNEDIDKDEAFFLMRTVEELSYRQLCLISIVNEIGLIPLDFNNCKREPNENASNFRKMDLISELKILSQRGIGQVDNSNSQAFDELPLHYQKNNYSELMQKFLKLDDLDVADKTRIRNLIIQWDCL